MKSDEEFIQQIKKSPGADWPRLEYADWLESQDKERAEFIRWQCEEARRRAEDPFDAEDWEEPCEHAERLLYLKEEKWNTWLRSAGLEPTYFSYARGMLQQIDCDVSQLEMLDNPALHAGPFLFDRLVLSNDDGLEFNRLGQSQAVALFHTLGLQGCTINDGVIETLSKLKNLANLRSLDLSPSAYAHWDRDVFEKEGWLLGPPALKSIARSPVFEKLEMLNVTISNIGQAGLDELASPTCSMVLRQLYAGWTQLTSKGCQRYFQSPNSGQLEILDLHGNDFQDGSLFFFQGSPASNLRVLHLGQTYFNPMKAMSALHDCFGKLEILYLPNNNFDDYLARNLMWFFNTPMLRKLDLSQNPMKGSLLYDLFLSGFRQLEHLVLHRCMIDDQGLMDGTVAASASSLRILNLSHNQIGDAGAKALARWNCLEKLEQLFLHGNPISEAGVQALLESSVLQNVRHLTCETSHLRPGTKKRLAERFASGAG